VKPRTQTADRRSSVPGRPPRGANESPPATTVARPAMCPERRRALSRDRVRRHRKLVVRRERVFTLIAHEEETLLFLLGEGYLAESDLENETAIKAAISRVWLALIRSEKG
jgi:hypothetical protein